MDRVENDNAEIRSRHRAPRRCRVTRHVLPHVEQGAAKALYALDNDRGEHIDSLARSEAQVRVPWRCTQVSCFRQPRPLRLRWIACLGGSKPARLLPCSHLRLHLWFSGYAFIQQRSQSILAERRATATALRAHFSIAATLSESRKHLARPLWASTLTPVHRRCQASATAAYEASRMHRTIRPR